MPAPSNPLTRGRLKTRHIMLLVHLDDQRSVLRAAKAANMTQPGASKLLTDLEESLGVLLFTRHARGVEPTQYGEIMTRHARSALAEMTRAQDEIAALRSGLAGQCTIGTVVSAGTGLAPTAVVSLKQRHPRIRVSIEIDNSAVLLGRLLRGEIDIALARISDAHGANELRFEALAGEKHHVIARVAHPLAGKRHVSLADLVNQPWILPPAGGLLRDRIDAMFVQEGLGLPRNLVETTYISVIISLLQKTDMVAAWQDVNVEPYRKAGLLALLPLTLDAQMEPFGIVTRRNHPMSPSAEAMLKCLREAADSMYPKSNAAMKTGKAPAASARRSRPTAAGAVNEG